MAFVRKSCETTTKFKTIKSAFAENICTDWTNVLNRAFSHTQSPSTKQRPLLCNKTKNYVHVNIVCVRVPFSYSVLCQCSSACFYRAETYLLVYLAAFGYNNFVYATISHEIDRDGCCCKIIIRFDRISKKILFLRVLRKNFGQAENSSLLKFI